jgi:hypothetical protein
VIFVSLFPLRRTIPYLQIIRLTRLRIMRSSVEIAVSTDEIFPRRIGNDQKEKSMNKQLRRRSVLTLLALLLVTACSREANQNQPVTTTTNAGTSSAPPATEVKQRGNALVRVIHAIPGGRAVDVFADDKKLFNNIAYKTTSTYEEASAERHTFRIRPAGQETAQPLAENSEGLSDGRH